MSKRPQGVLVVLIAHLGVAEIAGAAAEARFDYGCEPRANWCAELTCTFDGSTSTSDDGALNGYQWYFRRYLAEDRESETFTRSGVRVTHTYTNTRCRDYTFYATLEVTDSLGNKALHTGQVNPGRRMDWPAENQKPAADFTVMCDYLSCFFDGRASVDSDGIVVSYNWDFGDGSSASGETVPHTYAAAGPYSVQLVVSDNEGATGSRMKSVSVAAAPPPGFNLAAIGHLAGRGGLHNGFLDWTGATSTNVDVYRNGARIATTRNDGEYTDNTGLRGRATYVYQVCEEGTSTCSNEAAVVFD